MTNPTTLAERYVQLWNETDDARRRRLQIAADYRFILPTPSLETPDMPVALTSGVMAAAR